MKTPILAPKWCTMAATIVRRCPLRYHSLTSIRIEHSVAGFVRIRCFDAERQDFWVFRHGECPPSEFVENAIFEMSLSQWVHHQSSSNFRFGFVFDCLKTLHVENIGWAIDRGGVSATKSPKIEKNRPIRRKMSFFQWRYLHEFITNQPQNFALDSNWAVWRRYVSGIWVGLSLAREYLQRRSSK